MLETIREIIQEITCEWSFDKIVTATFKIVKRCGKSFIELFQKASKVTGIGNRAEQVRMAILKKLPNVKDCKDVTTRHLAEIKSLDLSDSSIASLQADDFSGLISLERLDLSGNKLKKLPERVFANLSSLKELNLSGKRVEWIAIGSVRQPRPR